MIRKVICVYFKECSDGTYGTACRETCGKCLDNHQGPLCDHVSGNCSNGCRKGFDYQQDPTCNTSKRL